MRFTSRRRPSALSPFSSGCTLLSLWTSMPLLTQALNLTPVPSANLDLSNLGKVGIVGDFNGISLYQYEQQAGKSFSANGSDSLWATLPGGTLAATLATDASIRAMCAFVMSSGKMAGVVIAGNFTSVDGTSTTAAALYDPGTGGITPLAGLEGEVHALYCDQEQNTVYVGGNFKGANSTNAIAWVGTDGWTNLPFAGFNGPVEAITRNPNGHIIFGGSFTGLGNASRPHPRDGQTINLSTANITAVNSATTEGYSNPRNIACASGSNAKGQTWLVKDNTEGVWDATFGFGFEPTKLRLWNTHQENYGTKTFRFIALPINGILNLTYVDPKTGQNQSCTSECPLSNDSKVDYQDFHFVNQVGMNRFQIAISAWYGSAAGLSGIQLFQDDVFSYAVKEFNEPSCRDVSFPSTATATGPWKESPSLQSTSKYLTAKLKGKFTRNSASVVFTPNIRQSGNYSVNIYTPGCTPDKTCNSRGRVNVTGIMSSRSGEADFSKILYQNNNFTKYDQIYFGYIEASSDSFKPTVTLSPLVGQDISPLTVVAQRVGFTLISSTGGLNGLYDYDPSIQLDDTGNFGSSTIDKLGATFDDASAVKALASNGETVYIGGNFTSSANTNIMSVKNDKTTAHLDGGLNGQVLAMHLEGNLLYVGGEFTKTRDGETSNLSHVAFYDPDANKWNPLGAGVDGPVQYVVPMLLNITANKPETVIALTGTFSRSLAFEGSPAVDADGFAIWVPSKSNWLSRLNLNVPSYNGVVTASLLDSAQNITLYAGDVTSAQVAANGAVTLDDAGLGSFGANIQPATATSAVSRRDLFSEGNTSGVTTGMFYDANNKNITILAGHFIARDSKGSNVYNLAFIDGHNNGSVSGLSPGIAQNASFAALDVHDNTLFAGGSVQGTVNKDMISGIVAWDLSSSSFASQPPPLSGSNGTVSSISVRQSSSEVYVGGSFTKAGALDCPGVCMYDTNTQQWNRPGNNFEGDVFSMMWTSKSQLIVGGNLTANGSETRNLAIYDAKHGSWSEFPAADEIPGPVHVITAASNDQMHVWISGSSSKDRTTYIMKYDGSSWRTANLSLSTDSTVRGLQVFSLTKNHDKADLLDKDQVLLLTGTISIPEFGDAAAAIFNGTDLTPFALTINPGTGASSISKIFSQKNNFFASGGHHLALGFVVLIGLAIALGLILLMVIAGVVLDRIRKRREGYMPAPTSMYDRGTGLQRIPPQDLLQSLGRGRPDAPRI